MNISSRNKFIHINQLKINGLNSLIQNSDVLYLHFHLVKRLKKSFDHAFLKMLLGYIIFGVSSIFYCYFVD